MLTCKTQLFQKKKNKSTPTPKKQSASSRIQLDVGFSSELFRGQLTSQIN